MAGPNTRRVKDEILRLVREMMGCKSGDLTRRFFGNTIFVDSGVDPYDALQTLIKDGEIIEIEYILPSEKEGSFYLPRNSDVSVIIGGENRYVHRG